MHYAALQNIGLFYVLAIQDVNILVVYTSL